jgi:hypothetical protein
VTAVAHVISTVAIWTMMLFGLRFAVSAGHWLLPSARASLQVAYCRGPDRSQCHARLRAAIDQLHVDLVTAIKTPWSATLLFAGSVLIGLGYFSGSLGDAARLVSAHPRQWIAFDVVTDCIAAVLAVTGMSFLLAAFSHHRTASFLVSGVLIVTGLGIGVVTL